MLHARPHSLGRLLISRIGRKRLLREGIQQNPCSQQAAVCGTQQCAGKRVRLRLVQRGDRKRPDSLVSCLHLLHGMQKLAAAALFHPESAQKDLARFRLIRLLLARRFLRLRLYRFQNFRVYIILVGYHAGVYVSRIIIRHPVAQRKSLIRVFILAFDGRENRSRAVRPCKTIPQLTGRCGLTAQKDTGVMRQREQQILVTGGARIILSVNA